MHRTHLAGLWSRLGTRRAARTRWVAALECLEERLALATVTPSITYSVVNDWGSGFQGEIKIANNLGVPLRNWGIAFDFNPAISNLWNARLVSRTGSRYTLGHAGYNATLAPGASLAIGFTATGVRAAPTTFTFTHDGASPAPTPPVPTTLSATATFTKSSDWGSGFTGQVTIANRGSAAINDWSLQFDLAATITNLWNGQLVSRTGNRYVVRDAGYNAAIATGQSVSFGFNGSPGNLTAVPTGYLLNGVALGGGSTQQPLPTLSINNITVTAPTTQSAANFFRTSGNQIVDSAGKPVKIAGVNWFGFETGNFVVHGLWARGYKDMMNQMVQLGFNTIRLPYSNDIFNPANVPSGINFALNPDLQGLSSLQIMDRIVAHAGQLGLRIILDHHSSLRDNHAAESLWYIPGSATYTEQAWLNNWVALARRYAGNATVIGADLHNEPHGRATWGDGNLATDWRLAAQRAGNAILQANPSWLIFVEGVETYQGKNYWWGGNLMGAGQFPVVLSTPNRLVYSPHDYPASVYPQAWFSAAGYPGNLPAIWDQHWGYLYRQNIAPIWLGEFGSKLQTTSDQQWYQKMTAYLADLTSTNTTAGRQGMSWTWWSWNPNSGDTGGILRDDWTSVDQSKVQGLVPLQTKLPGVGGQATVQATFVITLSAPSTQSVTVNYLTANGSATAGRDYVATSGSLVFAPGQTQATVTVTVLADPQATADRVFYVDLSNPLGGVLGSARGIGTIRRT